MSIRGTLGLTERLSCTVPAWSHGNSGPRRVITRGFCGACKHGAAPRLGLVFGRTQRLNPPRPTIPGLDWACQTSKSLTVTSTSQNVRVKCGTGALRQLLECPGRSLASTAKIKTPNRRRCWPSAELHQHCRRCGLRRFPSVQMDRLSRSRDQRCRVQRPCSPTAAASSAHVRARRFRAGKCDQLGLLLAVENARHRRRRTLLAAQHHLPNPSSTSCFAHAK